MTTRRIFALIALLGLAALARAESVHWEPSGGELGYNQVSELALVFEDCEPDGAPAIPSVDGLTFGRPSESSETSMVNFKVTRRYSLVYPVRPSRRANLVIPAFTVQTDKGAKEVKAAAFKVGDATLGRNRIALDDIATAKLEVPKNTFWAGEVIPVTFTLSVVQRYFGGIDRLTWQPTPLVAEEWAKPEMSETLAAGERRYVVTQTTRAYAKQPGNYSIKPAALLTQLITGSIGFGLFSQPQRQNLQVESNPLDLSIQALPPAPPSFSGIVGQFTLTSKVVPTAPAVGEPVTWTLELTGSGNWPDISGLPQREVSNDFQVVQPKSKRTMKDGSLFEGTLTEDVVLVPTRPGTYTLGSVKVVYFDTASGTYKTLGSEPVTVTVGPGTAAPAAQAAPGGPVQFSLNPTESKAPAAAAAPAAVPPVPPENLPRDPLPEARHGLVPFTIRSVVIWCLAAAVAVPLLCWMVLAALHSRETDPQRRRREARARLAAGLEELRRDTTRRPELLRRWQTDTAALWEIPHAAPPATLVHAVVHGRARDAAPAWSALWADADRVLHAKEAALPGDWIVRAEGALRAVQLPGWPPSTVFLPRNLLPFLFAAALVFLPGKARADAGADAYRQAQFAAAESAWRAQVAAAPSDWAARHNLGLALAQQDRWGEAVGQWTGAFLLAPRSDTTRWDLALGLQNSGLAPTELVELSRGKGRFALARVASPGAWQVWLIVASFLIGAALVVLLLRGYRRVGGWARPAAMSTILAAILLAAAANFSLRAYGDLAHPAAALVWRAALLRSIPTEADSTQKTSPLSAGSIAIADRTFLEWTHLTFAGGQAGWVRSDDVVRLYR